MARNVSEPEIDALLARREDLRPSAVARDFREPRRLSASDLDLLQRPAEVAAQAVLEVVRGCVPAEIGLDPVEVGETSLDLAIAEDAVDFVAAVADGPAGPSMVMLDAQAAVAIAEIAFGSDESAVPEVRDLTPLERNLIDRMLTRALERAAQVLQVAVKDPRALPNRATWARELGTDGDRRRVVLRIPLTIGPARAICHILLAGVKVPAPKNAPPARDARKASLPAEIAPTNVELCAVLARTDILLTELLALEPGDVITLDAVHGQPITIEIEGQPRARARFGTRDGRMAARIQEILKNPTTR